MTQHRHLTSNALGTAAENSALGGAAPTEPPPTIVLLSNGFQSEYEIGFANGLARNGLKPVLVCSDNLQIERLDADVRPINLRRSQDPRRHWAGKALNVLRYWASTAWLLLRLRPRVVHVIGLFTLPSTTACVLEAFALRCLATRFVLTVHDLLPHDAHHRYNVWAYRTIYRLPDKLVVHTARMRSNLVETFGVPERKVVLMEHGIDRVWPPPQNRKEWLTRRHGLDARSPVVLFFGNVARYKGPDLLIEAFKLLPESLGATLVLAGLCREAALREELKAQLAPLMASGRAAWHDGFVAEDEVLHYFHGADVLVMPYRHIDQSGVVFMALATGIPVVATDVGSLRDYVPLTNGLVVPPADRGALAAAIATLLNGSTPVDRCEISRAAENFVWRTTVLPTAASYRT